MRMFRLRKMPAPRINTYSLKDHSSPINEETEEGLREYSYSYRLKPTEQDPHDGFVCFGIVFEPSSSPDEFKFVRGVSSFHPKDREKYMKLDTKPHNGPTYKQRGWTRAYGRLRQGLSTALTHGTAKNLDYGYVNDLTVDEMKILKGIIDNVHYNDAFEEEACRALQKYIDRHEIEIVNKAVAMITEQEGSTT